VLGYQIEFLLEAEMVFSPLCHVSGLFRKYCERPYFPWGLVLGRQVRSLACWAPALFLERKVRAIKDDQEDSAGRFAGPISERLHGDGRCQPCLGTGHSADRQFGAYWRPSLLVSGFTYALLSLRPNRVMPRSTLARLCSLGANDLFIFGGACAKLFQPLHAV
jgi:hypothetical protein